MKSYKKENIILEQNRIVLNVNGKSIYNPSEQLLLENGWTVYEDTYSLPDKNLPEIDMMKERMCQYILDYYESDNVKKFYIDEDACWINKENRQSLINRYYSELKQNKLTTLLWINGKSYKFNTEKILNILYSLETYSAECYDVKQNHINKVNNYKSKNAVINYNYKNNYPEILHFNIKS